MQPQPDSQPIAGLFVPRLVARLHREGFDGSLRLHAGGSTRVVYFRRGDIASAASNADDDRLPSILIREGRLTAPQVEMAKQKQRAGVSLGKTLIELGFLTPSELLAGARRQVRQILAVSFALAEGSWQTVPGPLGPEVTNLGLPTRRLIFDALMESGDRGAIVREMGSMESIYRPAAGLAASLPTLRLDAPMEEVARMTDGRATLRELSGRTRLDDFTVSRIVLGLEILGLVELASRPEPAATARPASRLIPVESPPGEPAAEAPVPDDGRDEAVVEGPIAAPISAPAVSAASRPAPASPSSAPPAPAPPQAAAPAIASSAAIASPPPIESPQAGMGFASRPPRGAPAESAMPFGAPTFAAPSDADAEPPPFPNDELPAFATNGLPSPSGWSENPETGERVHAGPIELTFDGPVGPGGAPSATARRVAIAAVVLVVALGGAAAFFLRSGDAPSPPVASRQPAPPPDARAAAPSRAADRAAGDQDALPDSGAPGSAASGSQPPGSEAPEKVGGSTGAPGADAPGATAHASGAPIAAATPADPEPAPKPPVAEPAAAAPQPASKAPAVGRVEPARVEHPAGAIDLAAGQARLDAGDLGGAEAAFETAIRNAPAGAVTLQILIACDPANIAKARTATGPGGDLFALPVALKDRTCHRLLWGMYADAGTARADIPRLPAYFATAGVNPVPIAIDRLRRTR